MKRGGDIVDGYESPEIEELCIDNPWLPILCNTWGDDTSSCYAEWQ